MALQEKIALVTGATSGIGLAVAERLAAEGAHVIGCGRRENRLEEVADRLRAKGLSFTPMVCDLRNTDAIVKMFEEIRSHFGGLDILINNAGLGHIAPLVSGKTEYWREMLEVNVLALCVCTREAIRDMTDRGGGYVIHISSMSGHRVPGGSGMYSASKFAVRALTEGLRQELRMQQSPIRISSISPGFVETEFAEQYAKSKERAAEVYSRFKVLEARDIAEQALFLLMSPQHVEIHDILVRPTAQQS